MEADMVYLCIVEILCKRAFSLRPQELISIHERLFYIIYGHDGNYRDYNITKRERVLVGDAVTYSPHETIACELDCVFKDERNFSYDISLCETVHNIASFISRIWMIYPFAEGNTRTVAVFLIKYLQYLGFDIDGDVFADSSCYFGECTCSGQLSQKQHN